LPLAAAVGFSFLLQLATIYLPQLQPVFRTEALTAAELAVCVGCAAVVFFAVEAEKAWRRHARRFA
jgi:Ca2+-transporting ATPase